MTESPEHCELERQKTWSDIYSYSYNESLTGCVAQLEALEKFTKIIVGEKASVHPPLLHSTQEVNIEVTRFEGNFKVKVMDDSSDDEPDTPPNERR